MMTRDEAIKLVGQRIQDKYYDEAIEATIRNWQVENAKARINEFNEFLEGSYDGEPISLLKLNQNRIDELLRIARDTYQENRKAYLKENLDQYLHDLKYVADPKIYITVEEWVAIRAGQYNKLEVYRNWVEKTIDEVLVETAPADPVSEVLIEDVPVTRRRRSKNSEEVA